MVIIFPENDTSLMLQGPAGKLETLITLADTPTNKTVVICHPHPLFQGTMHNKVVYTTARACHNVGINTIRFNFRGVGASEGEYAHALGECEDLKAILAWLKESRPHDHVGLAGFSFGSYICAKVAQLIEPLFLITIAPAVENFDYKAMKGFACPWLMLMGDQDEVVSSQAMLDWYEHLIFKPKLKIFENAGHFFHGRLVEMREEIEAFLKTIE